eukprot:48825-Pyramimonas_sp.AAC.3
MPKIHATLGSARGDDQPEDHVEAEMAERWWTERGATATDLRAISSALKSTPYWAPVRAPSTHTYIVVSVCIVV